MSETHRPRRRARSVAVGIVGALATWGRGPEFGPAWYSVAIFAIPSPCAWAGGRLEGMRAHEDAPA